MDTKLEKMMLNKIKEIGFSRIPISFTNDKKAIVGILLSKSLVGYKIKN